MALWSHMTPCLAPEFSASLCIFLLCFLLKEPDKQMAGPGSLFINFPACPDTGRPGNTAPGFFSLLPWIAVITSPDRWMRVKPCPDFSHLYGLVGPSSSWGGTFCAKRSRTHRSFLKITRGVWAKVKQREYFLSSFYLSINIESELWLQRFESGR